MSTKKTPIAEKILVVDDDESILDALELLLSESDYSVFVASDETSLKEALSKKPDLILLDIWMSGLDGSEVCKKLKNQTSTKNIPIIFFSANKDIKTIAQRAGADAYISKPFQMNDLLKLISTQLNKKI